MHDVVEFLKDLGIGAKRSEAYTDHIYLSERDAEELGEILVVATALVEAVQDPGVKSVVCILQELELDTLNDPISRDCVHTVREYLFKINDALNLLRTKDDREPERNRLLSLLGSRSDQGGPG